MKLSQSVTETLCTLQVRQQQRKRVGKKAKYLVQLWRRLEKLMRSRHFKVWQYFSQQVDRSCCLLHLWVRDIYLINSWPFFDASPAGTAERCWPLPLSNVDFIRENVICFFNSISPSWKILYLCEWRSRRGQRRISGFVAYLTLTFLLEMLSLGPVSYLITDSQGHNENMHWNYIYVVTCALSWPLISSLSVIWADRCSYRKNIIVEYHTNIVLHESTESTHKQTPTET